MIYQWVSGHFGVLKPFLQVNVKNCVCNGKKYEKNVCEWLTMMKN